MQQESDLSLNTVSSRSYFFDEGLKFECSGCGKCCNGAPGIVVVLENEIDSISAFLELDRQTFIEYFLYPYTGEFSIREDDTGRCIFFENGCSIYPVRPLQCRTYPFWFTNLSSGQAWNDTARTCRGIGSGKLYSKNEVLEIAEASMILYKPFCEALGLNVKQPEDNF